MLIDIIADIIDIIVNEQLIALMYTIINAIMVVLALIELNKNTLEDEGR